MKKKFWTGDKLLSLTALMVSLLTLFVFVYQTNLIRQQQYMSVYPYLSLTNEYSGTLKYNYNISNEGIGPALIESVKVSTSSRKNYDDIVDYVDDIVGSEDSIWYFHSNLSVGRLIPAKEKIPLIQLVSIEMLEDLGIHDFEDLPLNTLDDSKNLYQILNSDSLKIEIIYSSVYDEKWVLRNHSSTPEKIE